MREIKFRAWDKSDKMMYYDIIYGIEFEDGSKYDFCNFIGTKETNDYHEWVSMQFTGLHDKNGKEIYEGDVMRYFECRNEKGEVWFYKPGYPAPLSWLAEITFKDGVYCIKNSLFEGKKGATWSFTGTQLNPNQRDWEVIGNIYENPELLKNGQ